MAGLDDLVAKGRKAFEDNREKIEQALHSKQAEDVSDRALDGAAGFAKKLTPDEHDARIDDLRAQADRHIGDDERR